MWLFNAQSQRITLCQYFVFILHVKFYVVFFFKGTFTPYDGDNHRMVPAFSIQETITTISACIVSLHSKDTIPKIRNKYSQVPFSTFMCLYSIYIPTKICLVSCRKICGPILGIYKSPQTHECGNSDWGRAIPRKGIHKWDFRCSVTVYETTLLCILFNLMYKAFKSYFACFFTCSKTMRKLTKVYRFFRNGTHTKRPGTERTVTKRPVTKRPVTKRPVTKRPVYSSTVSAYFFHEIRLDRVCMPTCLNVFCLCFTFPANLPSSLSLWKTICLNSGPPTTCIPVCSLVSWLAAFLHLSACLLPAN